MSRRRPRYLVNKKDFEELIAMGYEVHQFTPYHYRISKEEGDMTVEVFPTSRKYCLSKDKQMSQSRDYEDLLELIETQLK